MKKGQITAGSGTALVTGAGRGLGRQYAEQLAHLGYNLILAGKSDTVSTAADEINSENLGIKASAIILDLATDTAADELYSAVRKLGVKVDVLINNAGQFSFRDITETDDETIRRMLTLHNLTMSRLCKLFGKDMAENGGGHILNMSSYSVWMPLPGLALYGASKAYTRLFSVAFSKEMREKNVYVTAICPAGIATDLYGLSREMQALGVKLGVLLTPERCAKLSLNALWRHRRQAVPDWWNCIFIPILKHLPNRVENLIRRKTKIYQK